MTELDQWQTELSDLPTEPRQIAEMVQGLIIHEFWASLYGVNLAQPRLEELRTRPSSAMVQLILELDSSPLSIRREPGRRMVGNCRHFSTLACALFRQVDVPARARCGFSNYFEAGKNLDHWIVEYWAGERWVGLDAQLDDLQLESISADFNPSDVPSDRFLSGAEAWSRCRTGEADPSTFGILDMYGLWFIHSNLIRDLAALNKVELLPWDVWGPMTFQSDPDPATADRADQVAEVILSGDASAIRQLYVESGAFQVPEKVFDARFGVEAEVS